MLKATGYAFSVMIALVPFVASCGAGMQARPNGAGSPGGLSANVIATNNAPGSGTTGNSPQIQPPPAESYNSADALLTSSEQALKNQLISRYGRSIPQQWGETTTGVYTHMNTNEKVVALTFDACGGKGGSGYDEQLINYLTQQKIPATLFINSRWMDENPTTFMTLAKNPLFEIENHGYLHKPLSINGKSAWGIQGAQDVGEVVDEVLVNADKIQKLTGRRPLFFRSGTAYYDEYAVRIVDDLGMKCVNYSVLGDAGATFNTQQIVNACLQAKPGSIIICHMNHPEKDTAEGIIAVVPKLQQLGFRFVQLRDYPLGVKGENPSTIYTVRPGDTLWKISQSTKVPIPTLIQLNGIKDPNQLRVGQVLKISIDSSGVTSPSSGQNYTVRPGDTLWKISKTTGVSIQALVQANHLTNPDQLTVGEVLHLS